MSFKIIALVMLAAAGTVAAAAGVSTAAGVDFGASCTWYGHAPIVAGIEKGWFREAGADVKFQTIVSSADRMLALTSGAIGWTNTGQLAAVAEMAKGNKTFYWVGMIDEAAGQEGVAARPGIGRIADLRGKKIGVPNNSSAEVTLSLLLQDAGLGRTDVEIVPLTVTDITTAFARGQIDAYSIWQPTLSSALAGQAGARILATNADTNLYKKEGAVAAGDVVVMRRDLIDGSPQQASAIFRGLSRAIGFVKSNPAEAAAAIAPCYRAEPAKALESLRLFTYYEGTRQKAMAPGILRVLTTLVEWANSTGRISTRPDPAEWMNPKLWPE
jgi:ABC-type nitrate/sulfonate/bicarbonate transport system substrate-binding protein